MITAKQLKQAGIGRVELAGYLCRQAARAQNDDSSESAWFDTLWDGGTYYKNYTLKDCLYELDSDMTIDELVIGMKEMDGEDGDENT
jgi:hypothetical protein